MFNSRFFRVAFVAFCLTGLFSLMHPQPAQSEPPYPPKPDPGPGEQFEFLPESQPELSSLADELNKPQVGVSPQSFADWEITAVQSWWNDNYEVLLYVDGVYNLTANIAYDGNPDIDESHRRVAFESNRTGNYDIFVFPFSGGVPTNLTNAPWDEYDPVWSPDGTKIAFASNRTTNSNIFVMNSDGSGVKQLTWNAASNFSPSWSPDGEKIAWIQGSGSIGTIWIMNSDGSSPHVISAGIQYLNNLDWSPDGTRIGFDADLDGDYWNELGLINIDGSNLVQLYDIMWSQKEAWFGTWSSNGSKILFSYVELIESGGRLYISATNIHYLDVNDPSTSIPMITGGNAMSPDSLSEDILPPISKVNPLPAHSHDSGLNLAWTARDVGASGLDSYKIEIRLPDLGNQWSIISEGKFPTSSTLYDRDYCGVAYFRSVVSDRAENWEAEHVGDGDTWTKLIDWILSGQVLDNRGVALPQAQILMSPAPNELVAVDKYGRYNAYLCNSGTYSVNASVAGYGNPPPTSLKFDQDRNLSLYPPPTDNIISNGGFEDASPLNNWTTDGTLAVSQLLGHSGIAAAWISNNCQSEECYTQVENPFSGETRMSDIFLETNGTIHIAYNKNRYITRSPAGVWSAPSIIGAMLPPQYGNATPTIVVDSYGTVHAVMQDYEGALHYYIRPKSGSWIYVDKMPSSHNPRLVIDRQNTVYILYRTSGYYRPDGTNLENGFYIARRTALGNWNPIYKQISNTTWGEGSGLALREDGSLIMLIDDDFGFTLATLKTNGTLLSYRGAIATEAWEDNKVVVELHIGPNGTLIAHLKDNIGYHYIYQGREGYPLLQTHKIPNPHYSASMLVENDGTIHLIAPKYDETIKSYSIYPGSSELFTQLIANVSGDVAATLGSDNKLHLSIADTDDLYYTESKPLTSSNAVLSQSVAVPSTMTHPTLSYLYTASGDGSRMEVQIQADQVITSFAQPLSNSWNQSWIDLTPYSGQSIQVNFLFQQSSGQLSLPNFLLDEVTLGSWVTPAIYSVTPMYPHSWDGSILIVEGGNFLPNSQFSIDGFQAELTEYISESMVRITIPSGLSFGTHDVWVTNPDGKQSVLVGGLRLGYFVNLPVIRR